MEGCTLPCSRTLTAVCWTTTPIRSQTPGQRWNVSANKGSLWCSSPAKPGPRLRCCKRPWESGSPSSLKTGPRFFFPTRTGAGASMPASANPYTVIQLGASYPEIRGFVQRVKPGFNIHGFGDLSAEDIERLTGLSPKQAGLAKQREFTEPFLMEDDARIIDLQRAAEASGLKVTRGGRFYHLMGSRQDKGIALRRTVLVFLQNTHQRLLTIGLGDSANDLGMLESVDIPILIPHPDGSYARSWICRI